MDFLDVVLEHELVHFFNYRTGYDQYLNQEEGELYEKAAYGEIIYHH